MKNSFCENQRNHRKEIVSTLQNTVSPHCRKAGLISLLRHILLLVLWSLSWSASRLNCAHYPYHWNVYYQHSLVNSLCTVTSYSVMGLYSISLITDSGTVDMIIFNDLSFLPISTFFLKCRIRQGSWNGQLYKGSNHYFIHVTYYLCINFLVGLLDFAVSWFCWPIVHIWTLIIHWLFSMELLPTWSLCNSISWNMLCYVSYTSVFRMHCQAAERTWTACPVVTSLVMFMVGTNIKLSSYDN